MKPFQYLLTLKIYLAILAYALLVITGFAQSVPSLINYQGRLTDQTGAPIVPGLYGLQFRLWDSPSATNAIDLIWDQQQNVIIQTNGVFNVILGALGGSPIPGPTPQVNNLAYAFNGSNCFLGVTVAGNNSMTINNPSEILPRQQLLSVPYALTAANAANAANATNAAIAATVLAGSITTASLAAGAVTLPNLASRQVGTNVGVGGLAISLSSGVDSASALSVTITTTGRPVFVTLISDGSNQPALLGAGGTGTSPQSGCQLNITRDQVNISSTIMLYNVPSSNPALRLPPNVATTIDLAPPGIHTYSFALVPTSSTSIALIWNCRLVAFEL